MANYESKYLKYKNKYINLKNEYNGGGDIDIIVLYDDTNPIVNNLFKNIKDGYMNHYNTKENIKKKYYVDDSINLKKELNCVLNVYTYVLGSNKIQSEFRFKFDNLKNLISGGSRRMQKLINPINKAILKYKESSKLELKENNKKYIITNYNCDSLKLQLEQIMEFINKTENLNNIGKITATKALLELVKLYQELTTINIVKYQSTRIGKFFKLSPSDTLTLPAGVNAEIKIIGEESNDEAKQNGGFFDSFRFFGGSNESNSSETSIEEKENQQITSVKKEIIKNEEEKEKEINIKLKEYLNPDKNELTLNLNISNLTFNNLNNMIHLKITTKMLANRKNPLIEVINIFNK